MLFADDVGVEDSRGGVQGVHGGVDAELGNLAAEHGGGVEEGEGGGGCGVGEVVGGHVDGLDGGDGAVLGGSDSLLECAHLGGEGGLVAYCGWHSAEQCGHFGTCLGEAEDVVDEEEHVLAAAGVVAELFGYCKAGECDAETCARRLVHLAEHEGGLGGVDLFHVDVLEVPLAFLHAFFELFAVLHYAGFDHLAQQVVALACAFADAGEYGEAVVALGDVVDELHDEHGLAYAGSAEEADLAALGIGFEQVDYLDAGEEDLGGDCQFIEFGCGLVYGAQVFAV